MDYALINPKSRDRITAISGREGYCPCCLSRVIPKCGDVVRWHWAHISGDCDLWHEPETDWHIGWKKLVPDCQREVVIDRGGIIHRADVVTARGVVVEFQHSYICTEDIQARESFYGNMVWLFDVSDCLRERQWDWNNEYASGTTWKTPLVFNEKPNHFTFKWTWPRRTIACCTRPVYLDPGDGRIFSIKKLHDKSPMTGWGIFRSRSAFSDWIKSVL